MEPLAMKGDQTSGAGEGKAPPEAPKAGILRAWVEIISLVCLKTGMLLAVFYFGFLGYVAVEYTSSWSEKLRMLPLFLFSVTVPLLGSLMIRSKQTPGVKISSLRYHQLHL